MADETKTTDYSKLIISLTRNLPTGVTNLFKYPYLELGGKIDANSSFYLSGFDTSLERVFYDKKMFRFGSVSLVLSVVSNGAGGRLQEELRKVFFKQTMFIDLLGVANSVSVTSCKPSDIVYIARNYYLQGYDVRTSCAGEYKVTLKCYSLDRKLSLSKYCQVYTGKRMATGIASKEIEKQLSSISEYLQDIISKEDETLGAFETTNDAGSTALSLDKVYFSDNPLSEIDVRKLLMLGYKEELEGSGSDDKEVGELKDSDSDDKEVEELKDSDSDDKEVEELKDSGSDDKDVVVLSAKRTLDKNNKELKHPYLVQYNESFYDFITRVAHRCGEFFFFEHGKIIIGLPEATRKVIFGITRKDDGYSVPKIDKRMHFSPLCSFSDMMCGENEEDGNSGISSYNGDYINTPESSPIDKSKKYFHSAYTSDESLHVVTEDDNRYHPVGMWILYKALGDLFTSDSFIMGIGFGAGYAAWNLIWLGLLAPLTSIDPDYKKKHISNGDNKRDVNDLGEGVAVDAMGAEDIANLCNNYYRDVNRWEQKAAETLVKIDFESSLKQIYLGDTICLDNLDGSPACVVVSMHGEYSCGSAQNTAEVVPITLLSEKRGGLWAVLNPVAGEVEHTRKESSLEAIVTDVEDPLRLGRVRVRYPWQPEDTSDKSPWLRVKVPFAGGTIEYGVDSYHPGFCMTPGIGEHVMLDFMDGNMEYPFVSGSFYYLSPDGNTDHVPPVSLGINDTATKFYKTRHQIRTVASGKGHALVFEDKENTDLLSQVIPLAGAITQAVQVPAFKETGRYQANEVFGTVQGGSVTLRDGTGLTTITLTPNKRQIDIDSRLGKINLNAFTGITINAPNGDVVIKGKNVSIEAGNNLSLTSGKNIQSGDPENLVSETLAGLGGMLAGVGLNAATEAMGGVTVENLFDLSFLRSIVETALRPVEGTLSLRSRRNVVMTAGTGNVTLTSSMMSQASTWKEKKSTEAYSELASSKANDDAVKNSDYVTVRNFLKECVSAVDTYYSAYKDKLVELFNTVIALQNHYCDAANEIKGLLKTPDTLKTNNDFYEYAKGDVKSQDEFFDNNTLSIQVELVKSNANNFYKDHKELFDKAHSAVVQLSLPATYKNFLQKLDIQNCQKINWEKTMAISDDMKEIKPAVETENNILSENLFSGDLKCMFDQEGSFKYKKDNIESEVTDMMKKVKKYIIVQTLLNFKKVKIKRADGLEHCSISHKSASSGGYETSFSEDLKKVVEGKVNWGKFVPLVVKNTVNSSNDKSTTKFFKNAALALLKYVGGNPINSFKKLTNYNGASGPRAFSDPGGNGHILMSSDAGHFSIYSDTSDQWEKKYNPDPWTIKKYIATIDRPQKFT